MSIPYEAPLSDIIFTLKCNGRLDQIQSLPVYEEATDELVNAILTEAARVGGEIFAPINHSGDMEGSSLTNSGVVTPKGWKQAYKAFQEGGWMGLGFDIEDGGQGMPDLISTAVNEIWHSSNMAFSLCPLLTQGAIEALVAHGNEALKARFLPNMMSGEWSGTMNLTESQAGSDLGLIRTSAKPHDDHYLIKGQKIFITYGEHDLNSNIIHLVLARLPDAPEGVRGISLFLVPRYNLNEAGHPDAQNDLKCIKTEHKLGIHASPTCVMSFGEKHGAIGYLIGEENAGLKCMFTMMNKARHSVGLEGLAISERSFQQALAYARDRIQSNPAGSDKKHAPIIEHPDVRRMLLLMKSNIQAMRALCYWHASCMDLTAKSDSSEVRSENYNLMEFLTPIVKGWCTESCNQLTSLGIQIHGGMGYIEETGAAQHYRDARIAAIYEGTTAIQANDLLGRKLMRDQGKVANHIIEEALMFIKQLDPLTTNPAFALIKNELSKIIEQMSNATEWLLKTASDHPALAAAGSVNYLNLCGLALAGWQLSIQAVQAQTLLDKDAEHEDKDFLEDKILTAQFFAVQVLPSGTALKDMILNGSEAVLNARLAS